MTAVAVRVAPRYHRWPGVLGTLGALAVVAFATCEVLGWPFLVRPMQNWLTQTLHRPVSFAVDGRIPASVTVRLLGRVRVDAPLLTVAGPPWAATPAMLRARDAALSLRYSELWRALEGEPPRIRVLEAAELHVDLTRLSDGRASWRFVEPGSAVERSRGPMLADMPFDELKAGTGSLRLRDELTTLQIALRVADPEGRGEVRGSPQDWTVDATGSWNGQPVSLTLRAAAPLPWIDTSTSMDNGTARLAGQVGDERIDAHTALADVRGAALIISRWIHTEPNASPAR